MVANPAPSNGDWAMRPVPIGLSANRRVSQSTVAPMEPSPNRRRCNARAANPGGRNAELGNAEHGNSDIVMVSPNNSSDAIKGEAIMARTINTMPYAVQQNCEGRQWWETVSQRDMRLVSMYRRQLNRSNRQRANQALRNAVANGDLDNLDIPNLDRRNARWWAS